MATNEEIICLQETVRPVLRELRFGAHRIGYNQLLLLIPWYASDPSQSLTKELYPAAAKRFGYSTWKPVEHAVRIAILDAWERRDPAVWGSYFPGMDRPPSNKLLIATVAEWTKNAPPG